ncbi:hypothetical protein GmHk_11G032762 [Glycine max]|nr:hypothetical protein GmHk_11G032762 [Glycine max]
MPLKGKQLVVYPCKTLWRALSITHNYTSCIPQQVKTLMLLQKWEKRNNNNDSRHITSVLLWKMVGYTPSIFADLVFTGEMIEVGLKRGKFDHHALINAKKLGQMKRPVEFTPIPVPYANLLPYLLDNSMVAITPAKVHQPPFLREHNSNATCACHGEAPGHSIEHCRALKRKVQGLIDAGWGRSETFKEYAQRWRDLAAQVAPPMVEREMITMMVDTLPVFYYEKLVGYMSSSFADLVFAGERIEVGLKRWKFDYVSSTSANAKRIGATGAKRKEGDAHVYAQHHPSFSAHAGNSSNSAPVQPKALVQREAPQVPTPTTTRPAGNSNAMRNFPPRPIPEFTPLPMTYEDLLPSLIANQLAVITLGKIFQPPFPKWYDPNATCTYHGNTPGHSIEKCLAIKYKVQHLIDAGWLTFQEDRPNVKTNPLANHGGGAVNAIESDRPRRSKPLKDVATPRRFIFEALQKGGVIPPGGHKEDSCLLHPGELHSMETCLAVEELLQGMIDQGRLEVGDEGREEQHICMQSVDERSFGRPKPLVIYFTKGAASQKPRYPSAAKPVPFPYQNNHAVPWRYTPPNKMEEEATDISSLSAKVTNITGLSGVTRSGRVFAPPDLPIQPTNVKGKAKVVEEQDDKTPLTPNEDISVKGLPKKRDGYGKKEVSLEEANEFLRIIQQSEFKVMEQLNTTPARVSLLELLMSSEPHRE